MLTISIEYCCLRDKVQFDSVAEKRPQIYVDILAWVTFHVPRVKLKRYANSNVQSDKHGTYNMFHYLSISSAFNLDY